MSRKYVLAAAGAAALGAAAAGRGQRSRRIWLGMQGLPSQGRRAGKRWHTGSNGINQFGTQMWTVTYGDRVVADISKPQGENFHVVFVSGPNRGREESASSLADAKKLVKHLSGGEWTVGFPGRRRSCCPRPSCQGSTGPSRLGTRRSGGWGCSDDGREDPLQLPASNRRDPQGSQDRVPLSVARPFQV